MLSGADRAWVAAFYAGDVRGGYCVLHQARPDIGLVVFLIHL